MAPRRRGNTQTAAQQLKQAVHSEQNLDRLSRITQLRVHRPTTDFAEPKSFTARTHQFALHGASVSRSQIGIGRRRVPHQQAVKIVGIALFHVAEAGAHAPRGPHRNQVPRLVIASGDMSSVFGQSLYRNRSIRGVDRAPKPLHRSQQLAVLPGVTLPVVEGAADRAPRGRQNHESACCNFPYHN